MPNSIKKADGRAQGYTEVPGYPMTNLDTDTKDAKVSLTTGWPKV